ncbi:MAG: hypothetical protein WC279_10875 [Sulfurimonas sp.]|jgi:hypothetical protein|uniref:hypothetical protein n=1 Tax=Sulfurimonas sp. TaxID=2022749 RepID=UPI0035642220
MLRGAFLTETEGGVDLILDSFQQVLRITAKWGVVQIGAFRINTRKLESGGYEGVLSLGNLILEFDPVYFNLNMPGMGSVSGRRDEGITLLLTNRLEIQSPYTSISFKTVDMKAADINAEISGAVNALLAGKLIASIGDANIKGGSLALGFSGMDVQASDLKVRGETVGIGAAKGLTLKSAMEPVSIHGEAKGVTISSGPGASAQGSAGDLTIRCNAFVDMDARNIKTKKLTGQLTPAVRYQETEQMLEALMTLLESVGATLALCTTVETVASAGAAGTTLQTGIQPVKQLIKLMKSKAVEIV